MYEKEWNKRFNKKSTFIGEIINVRKDSWIGQIYYIITLKNGNQTIYFENDCCSDEYENFCCEYGPRYEKKKENKILALNIGDKIKVFAAISSFTVQGQGRTTCTIQLSDTSNFVIDNDIIIKIIAPDPELEPLLFGRHEEELEWNYNSYRMASD